MDDVPHTVVGVMPEGFRLLLPPDAGVPEELSAWVPWGSSYDELRRTWRIFTVVARLEPDADFAKARGELAALSTVFQQDFAEDYETTGLDLQLHPLEFSAVGHVRSTLFLLLGAVGFVFLVACANIANLMLVRASGADREMVLRIALGASRLRLVRQLATESAVLSLAGAALGMAIARWGVEMLKLFGPTQLPRLASVEVSGRVLLLALALAVTTSVVFGIVSALHISQGGNAHAACSSLPISRSPSCS